MIKKDKTVYLNYVRDIKNKVDELYSVVETTPISKAAKQDIDKICINIFAKTSLLTLKANQEVGLIPNIEWMQYKQDIEKLYQSLSNAVQQAVACSKKKDNTL